MMYHRLRRFFQAAVPMILLASLLSGCGGSRSIYTNYRAIEELQTVQTLGIDLSADVMKDILRQKFSLFLHHKIFYIQ